MQQQTVSTPHPKRKKSEKQIQLEQSRTLTSIATFSPSHFLRQENFKHRIRKFSEPSFSNTTQFGPQHIPENFHQESQSFLLFSQEVLDHMLAKTNACFCERDYRLNQGTSVLQIQMQDLVNYWCLYWAMGLNRLGCRRLYWTSKEASDGLYGVDFFKMTMGYRMWTAIDRCLQAELPVITEMKAQKNFEFGV